MSQNLKDLYFRLHEQYFAIRRKLYGELSHTERALFEQQARKINELVGRINKVCRPRKQANRIFQ